MKVQLVLLLRPIRRTRQRANPGNCNDRQVFAPPSCGRRHPVSFEKPARVAYITLHDRVFIKDQIEATAPLIDSALVLARSNVMANLSRVPGLRPALGNLKQHASSNAAQTDAVPANVRVQPLRVASVRPDGRNRRRPKLLAKAALRAIRKTSFAPTAIHAHFLHPPGAAITDSLQRSWDRTHIPEHGQRYAGPALARQISKTDQSVGVEP